MIIGAHSIIYSKDSDADRAFLRDVLGFPNVDVGDIWLIFGMPPAEVAVHPSDENEVHELYLMTDDVEALVAAMQARGVATEPISNQGWGMLTATGRAGGWRSGRRKEAERSSELETGRESYYPTCPSPLHHPTAEPGHDNRPWSKMT